MRLVGKFFEDVGVNGGTDEVVAAGMSEALEAEVGVAFDDADAVAGFKTDGNANEAAGLEDFALQALRRNRTGAGSADGEQFEGVLTTVKEAEIGDAGFVLLKGAEVVL